MPNKAITYQNTAADEAASIGEKLSDTAEKVKDKVTDLGNTAANKIDENRDAAASGLASAASSLHEKADSLPGGEKVVSLAHSAADTLDSTAQYVRGHDVSHMKADLERLVKNNPGPAILGAIAIGFLVGRAFSSND